ncbi:MAG: pantoate--beta-alanine ligase [Balneolales bacterium]
MIKSSIQVTHNILEVRKAIQGLRNEGLRVGFVPTMGALHEGHISLIKKAKELAEEVVVSIFVNPAQFGPNEDYASYPRPFQKDLDLCEEQGVSIVFHPEVSEMYSGEEIIKIQAGAMAETLCGRSRPGHFDGVLQVVNKLFNITRPDLVVFGQKDIQQFFIIKEMVEEFKMDIDLVMAPTKREPDGLAISSRNIYLTESQRKNANKLYEVLGAVSEVIKNGGNGLQEAINMHVAELNNITDFKTDYISCVEPPKMQHSSEILEGRTYIIVGAVYAGQTRLIDNLIIHT